MRARLTKAGWGMLQHECRFCRAKPGKVCLGIDERAQELSGWQHGVHIGRFPVGDSPERHAVEFPTDDEIAPYAVASALRAAR